MKAERLLAVACVLALSASACAGDKQREVKSAQAELQSAQERARAEEERLKAAQAEAEHAQREGATEAVGEHAEELAEAQKDVAEAEKEMAKARAEMQAESSKFQADARERLNKATAKAIEVQNRSAEVPEPERNKLMSALSEFESKKQEIQKQIGELDRASPTDWKQAKDRVNSALDDLENRADKLSDFL